MKKTRIIIWMFSSFIVLLSCTSPQIKTKEQIFVKASDIVTQTIDVKGMTCVGCEVTLESNISKIKGVVSVKASASKNKVEIKFDKTKTDKTNLIKEIKKSGYKPIIISTKKQK